MAKEPFAARLTTIWLGGLCCWMLTLFKGSFSEQISDKYERRNLWAGYLVQLFALVAISYFLFFKS